MHNDLPQSFPVIDINVVTRAFEAACADLNRCGHELDNATRKRLACSIVRLAKNGERNVEALHRRAVMYVKSTSG